MGEYLKLVLKVMCVGIAIPAFILIIVQSGEKSDRIHGSWQLANFVHEGEECSRVLGLDAGRFDGTLFLTSSTLLVGNNPYHIEHKSFYDDEVKIVLRDAQITLRRTDNEDSHKWNEMEWKSGDEVLRFVRQ